MTRGQRFARLVTEAVVRWPVLWRFLRRPLRGQFERLAPRWDSIRSPGHMTAFVAAIEALPPPPPRSALDVGTGTGDAVFAIARRFPDAQVVGVDIAEAMVVEARRKTPADLAGRVRFEVVDAVRLPFEDDSFDLVAHVNMIPFFDELARVTAPGGHVLFGFSLGPSTPIYVSSERLRRELERRGFAEFADFAVEPGTAFLARRRDSS